MLQQPKTKTRKDMKKVTVWFRALVVGVGILAANVFAANYLITAGGGGPSVNNGIIYSVPAGANYEWEVSGSAHIMVGGGGLNVNEYGSSGYNGDVGNTSYADDLSYQLNEYGDGGYALLYLGW